VIKREELATHESCLNRAHDDEPLFVLRANDSSAPYAVMAWADDYCMRKKKCGGYGERAKEKFEDAYRTARMMIEWRGENRA